MRSLKELSGRGADFVFGDTSEEAYQQTINRNVAGVQLSRRLWAINNENVQNINTVVQDSVRIGKSVTAAGKLILEADPEAIRVGLPKYVQELQAAAIKARALSDNSILQRTVKQYESYINSLTRGGQPEYAHLGIRGASRMLVKRLSSANDEVYASAVDKWVGRKASYQARTVARNETNEAHWRAYVGEAQGKPYVTGFQWNLGSHPRADICDQLHTQDLYGLGPGVYVKDGVPARPHVNCNCWLSQIFDSDYFKNYQPSEEMLQSVRDDLRFPEFQSWANGWLDSLAGDAVTVSLASLTVSELRAVAQEYGIDGADDMTRDELLSILKQVRGE